MIINALILSSDVYKEFKVFQTKSVKELLWGYEHYMVKIAHDMGLYPLKKVGIYYGKNGTVPGNVTVKTGKYVLVAEWIPEIRFSGTRNQPKNGFKAS